MNVRVNSSIIPQRRTRMNLFSKNQKVLVIDGPHRGLCGKVSRMLIGGWCFVSGLHPDQPNVDVIMRSTNIELIDCKDISNMKSHPNVKSWYEVELSQKRILCRSTKLRLEALVYEEEHIKSLLKSNPFNTEIEKKDFTRNGKGIRPRNKTKLIVSRMMASIEMRLLKPQCTGVEFDCSLSTNTILKPNTVKNDCDLIDESNTCEGEKMRRLNSRLVHIQRAKARLKSLGGFS